eukprot:4031312-Heterocapsa_arctica.AAC.1
MVTDDTANNYVTDTGVRNKTMVLCEPLPLNPAEYAALRRLCWCSETLYFQEHASLKELRFRSHR